MAPSRLLPLPFPGEVESVNTLPHKGQKVDVKDWRFIWVHQTCSDTFSARCGAHKREDVVFALEGPAASITWPGQGPRTPALGLMPLVLEARISVLLESVPRSHSERRPCSRVTRQLVSPLQVFRPVLPMRRCGQGFFKSCCR